jgi:hypothetical protein
MASKAAIGSLYGKRKTIPTVKSLKIFMRYMQFESQDYRKLRLLRRFSLISVVFSDSSDAIVDFDSHVDRLQNR